MTRKLLLLITLYGSVVATQAQTQAPNTDTVVTPVYTIKKSVDIPVFAGAAAIDIYNFTQISKKEGTTDAQLATLSKNDVPWYDRWAIRPYDKHIDKLSYIPFFAAMPLPLAVFGIDNRMRKDFWKLTFLYGEAITLTGVLYTTGVHYVHRKRPLVYEPTSPEDTRKNSNSTNSFFAGHVALVGTSVFFIAQAYADYHPESHIKWVFYGGASAITGLTAFWRSRAGEHFPSDIALGTAVGVASGLLTPILHRTKMVKNRHLSIVPFSSTGAQGLAFFYKL